MSEYRTIVADPPWPIRGVTMGHGGRRRRSTQLPYQTMELTAIEKLPVRRLAAPHALLFLWSTRELFREGVAARVARSWGFEPCGEIIWGLRNPGLGSAAIVNDHEPVLVARRGRAVCRGDVRGIGVVFWKQPYDGVNGKTHSAKPDGFLDLVETLGEGPRLELFARRQRLGWDTWGDQALEHVSL